MKRPHELNLLLTILLMLTLACGETLRVSPAIDGFTPSPANPDREAKPRGTRVLEMHLNESETGSFDQAVEKAKSAGANSASLSIFWDEIETTPGSYKPDPNLLRIANQYYPSQDMRVSLVISVLDTTQIRLPADLQGKSLHDPAVIRRFQALLDYIASQIHDLQLASLAIGNEIDGVLGVDPAAWEAYQVFFQQAKAHAKSLWPEVPIGAKIQYSGLTGESAAYAASLNQMADVVMVTYYPLRGDFTVQDPDVIHRDLKQLVRRYPDQRIYLAEIGYPTGETNGSSPEKQAAFIRETFAAWDDHADQIPLLSYSWLTDLPSAAVSSFEDYYGVKHPAFASFLRTLGLRTYPGNGSDKAGFHTLVEETRVRDW